MENLPEGTTEKVESTPVSTPSEPARIESKPESSSDDKPERKQSLRANLRSNLRQKDSETEAARPSGQVATVTTATPGTSTQEDFEPVLPPPDMNAQERAQWDSLSREAQKYLSRRAYEMRSSFTRKTQEIGQREKELSSVYEVVTPIQEEYARKGVSVADIVRRSVAWDKAFQSNPVEAAREYLEAYGIDPSELMQVQSHQSQSQSQFDPESVREQIRQEMMQEFQRREQEQTTHNNYNLVQQFIASKPLFRDPGTAEQLEAEMAPIVAGLKQSNPNLPAHEALERAYNYVTKGHPQFSSLQQKLEAKAEAEKAKAEAQKAMQASRSISGGPGSGSPQRKIKDIRENLRLRYRGAL